MAYPVALSEHRSDHFSVDRLPDASGASKRKTAMIALSALALFGASVAVYAGGWMVAAPAAIITVFFSGAAVFAISAIALTALACMHRTAYQKRQKALTEFSTLGLPAYRTSYVPKTISESELKVFINEEALKATSYNTFINKHTSAALAYLGKVQKDHLKALFISEMKDLLTSVLIGLTLPTELLDDAQLADHRYQLLVGRFSSLDLSKLTQAQKQELIDCINDVYNDEDKAVFKAKLLSSYGSDKVLDLYRDYKSLFINAFF